MKNVSELYQKTQHPVRILQFGEGNFLRAFVDYFYDIGNLQSYEEVQQQYPGIVK